MNAKSKKMLSSRSFSSVFFLCLFSLPFFLTTAADFPIVKPFNNLILVFNKDLNKLGGLVGS